MKSSNLFGKKTIVILCIMLYALTQSHAQSYPEMITVEGGTFTMGDTEMEGDKVEQPSHQVNLTTYKIAKTQTTVAQWKTYCSATGRSMPPAPNWGWKDNHPIVNVSYSDVLGYCDWLSDKTRKTFRLPTEAEWEFAAKGGKLSKGFKYSGGQNLDMTGWYEANSNKRTQPVAQKRANELGIYDMSGNVWEWCRDWYGEYSSESQTDPNGAASGSYRVLRGGGWYYSASCCRVAHRNYYDPAYRDTSYGFRVVLSQ